jgi:two-component system, OmpR family, KDP operon response regulator KdpE
MPDDGAAGQTVLVVEDEAPNRALVRAVLSRSTEPGVRDVRLVEAPDLATARAILGSEQIAVILLDVRLPDGNGLDLARELRDRDGPERPRVLILSASVLPNEQVAALASGADGFLAKPYRPADLVANVIGLLRKDSQAS